MRPRTLTFAAGGVGALVTLVVTGFPFVRFAYSSLSLHVALETGSALIAALAGYLVYGRVRRRCSPADLALFAGLVIFALANFFLSVVPTALGDERRHFSTWAPLLARLVGAALFAASAVLPAVPIPHARRRAVVVVALSAAVVAMIAAVVVAFASRLPAGLDPKMAPNTLDLPEFAGSPAITTAQLAAAFLFVAAAVGFTRRAEQTGDDLLKWLAAASTLAAFARVNYAIFPSLYTDWVYTGDLLRFGFYAVVLGAAAREIHAYWQEVAEAAALDERRRLARDLHDGLAQELAFIAANARSFAAEGDRGRERLATAADRALAESRRAIAALTMPDDQPLAAALADLVEEIAERAGLELQLELSEDVDVSPDARDALLRIAREAITNSARHGHATAVRVELSNDGGIRLRIADNGSGFDTDLVATSGAAGFGLASMRERARALGGGVAVRSRPGHGTEVDVALP
ncbi:MAG: sensor histidine kinase [Actinomycetota bacterium]|nr:sensor histidine kinase [Actinomycetota bacterium]